MKKEPAITAACRQEEQFRGLQYEADKLARELGEYRPPERAPKGRGGSGRDSLTRAKKDTTKKEKRHTGKKWRLSKRFPYVWWPTAGPGEGKDRTAKPSHSFLLALFGVDGGDSTQCDHVVRKEDDQ